MSAASSRRAFGTLAAALAVAGAALATAPAAHAAQSTDCGQLPPPTSTRVEVATYRGGALDLPYNNEADGQRVGTYTPNGSPAQTWTVWRYCDGTSAISHGYDKVLEAGGTGDLAIPQLGSATRDGLNSPWGGVAPAQKWRLTDGGNGWRMARNAVTGQCLKSNGVGYLNSMAACDQNDAGQWWQLG
ncbi:ricin-type beta-trefoil lectin domain protein [Streptomyces sp. NPDC048659]|uniref:RICIN domain-containing protein n=1 Tax=Streptomyces sp. NPDC048659 TaxID=3155489 RepID=UPI003433C340